MRTALLLACFLIGCGSPAATASPAAEAPTTASPGATSASTPSATLDLKFLKVKATMLGVVDGLLAAEGARPHLHDGGFEHAVASFLEADQEFWRDHGELVERYPVMEEYDEAVNAYVDAVLDDRDPWIAVRMLERVRDQLASQ